MKRLDLIFSERELDAIINTLEKANVPGYTVMKHATGRGPERVVTEDMEFTGLGSNAHVIVFCEQELIDQMRDNIKSDLSYYGGVAYISEATPLWESTTLGLTFPFNIVIGIPIYMSLVNKIIPLSPL